MPAPRDATACLALADGTLFFGKGFGAVGETVAELVFNTAMTGYQEIMTDPSYAGQVVTFTFPHVGNVGVTPEDDETQTPSAAGMVVKWDPTEPSNWRATGDLANWMAKIGRIGMGGVDTRRLTRPPLVETATREPPAAPRLAFVRTPAWPQAEKVTDAAFTRLAASLGAQEVTIGPDFDRVVDMHRTIMDVEMASNFASDYERGADSLSKALRILIERGRKALAVDYAHALAASPSPTPPADCR